MKRSGTGHAISMIDRGIRDAAEVGAMLLTADDVPYSGRYVQIEGHRVMNFGGCSYLGLEQRRELKEGAIRAIERYGTQFSFSRAYLQSPLCAQLESALEAMTGGFALVAPSTTLGHIAALPVLAQPGDAVLIDQFAHASLHTAAGLLGDIPVVPVRHNRVDLLERKIERLAASHKRVWYLADGLYSMLGDFAALDAIGTLLAKYPQLHLYIDDAHSTSWLGQCGRGYALDRFADRSRVVVALSLNKAFSAGGGALIFPSDEQRLLVRRCGGPMLFSGPVQPPMLGAGLAAATLHLRNDFKDLQRALAERIAFLQAQARELEVPLADPSPSPIFFATCGPRDVATRLARALRTRGFWACPGGFPAVPLNRSGVRFTVSLHNTEDDIRAFLLALRAEMRAMGIADFTEPVVPNRISHRPTDARRGSTVPPATL